MEIAELIERLEKATGPDRKLDDDIAISHGWTFEKMKRDARPYWREPGQTEWFARSRSGPPAYTSSIDAALTLVPEGMDWSISSYGGTFIHPGNDAPVIRGEGRTPVLTLCVAALRARIDDND